MSAHTLCAEVHAAQDSTMKSKIVSIILSIAAVAWLPLQANAYCIGWDKSLPNFDPNYYSISHEYRRSKYVVTARVVRETWLGLDGKPRALEPPFQYEGSRPWGFDPYIGALYDAEVVHVFKGKPAAQLRLFSENSTARFWLEVGDEFIMFVTEELFDPPIGRQITIDTCGNSAPAKEAQTTVRSVERISRSR
jgi:hypothetical protein